LDAATPSPFVGFEDVKAVESFMDREAQPVVEAAARLALAVEYAIECVRLVLKKGRDGTAAASLTSPVMLALLDVDHVNRCKCLVFALLTRWNQLQYLE
jgi:hypothetical protein